MNIANIFGLHLGCMVRCRDFVFTLTSIDTHMESVVLDSNIKVNGKRTIFTEFLKDCKLILKPLSKITNNDKAELEEFIKSDDNKHREVYNVHWCPDLRGLKYRRLGSNISLYDDSPKIMFKLATMGYDIGITPDEYKEVDE
jgi:hypothetical protein